MRPAPDIVDDVSIEDRRHAIDLWLRSQGMPTLVPADRWLEDLPRRSGPVFVWLLAVLTTIEQTLVPSVAAVDDLAGVPGWVLPLTVLAITAIGIGFAQVLSLLVRGALRRLPRRLGTLLCIAAPVVGIVGIAADLVARDAPASEWVAIVQVAALALACLAATAVGSGPLLSWTARLAIRNVGAVGHMASIALPVILMLVIFAFFSAELWQLTAALDVGRIVAVGAVFVTLALLVVLRICASEIDDLQVSMTPAVRAELATGTPAAGIGEPADATYGPLTRMQRINILLVMGIAQLSQAAFFAALLTALLVIVGCIAIPPEVVAQWLGDDAAGEPAVAEPVAIGSVDLPVSVNLVKVAVFLSLVASLTFVLSAVSERRYRDRFFDPIMSDLRRAIAVHQLALAAEASAPLGRDVDAGSQRPHRTSQDA